MMKRLYLGLVCSAVLAAQTNPPAPKPIQIPIQEYKLENGLRVILSEDHSAPTYAIAVTYNVGSRDEKPGRTGFAHLFEHMMFQGSENVGKGEQMMLVQNNGGNINGTTNAERTNYFEAFPSNQLDLGLFLEADRMRSLAITQPNLDNQRNAVQEERRLRVDNQPYGKTYEALPETAFDNFAYKHSTIGSMEDLNAATLKDLQDFFRIYYAPNNAVLTLVGDFKPEEALAKVKKYFGGIPAQKKPPEVDTAEPEQKAERRKTLEDAFAPLTRLDIAFKIPSGDSADFFAADVAGDILANGQSSRLYQSLVKDKELVANIGAYVSPSRGRSLLIFTSQIRPGKDVNEVEKLVLAEIDKLKTEPVSDQELQKIRMINRRMTAQQMNSTLARAIEVGTYTVMFNDPEFINKKVARSASVTKDDVERVAKQFFGAGNRTVLITVPKPRAAANSAAKQ